MAETQLYVDITEAYPDLRWTLATKEQEYYRSQLADWFGRDYSRRLVSRRGTVWFVKCKNEREKKRDKLAALLGDGWLNIAAVEYLTARQLSEILSIGVELPANATHDNTYLVRFASDYVPKELPIKNPDLATASELVFSLWIRRRDAHSFNRVYQENLPVFFDCGVAFLGERRLASVDQFFRPGPDPGYAGLWRIRPAKSADLNTMWQRRREKAHFLSKSGKNKVFVPIINQYRFLKALDNCADRISEFNSDHIKCMIDEAGFHGDEAIDIFQFLNESRHQLKNDIQYLSSMLTERH